MSGDLLDAALRALTGAELNVLGRSWGELSAAGQDPLPRVAEVWRALAAEVEDEQRRRQRLEKTKYELQSASSTGSVLEDRLAFLLGRDSTDVPEHADDLTGAELEDLEEEVVDAASASETIAELDKEIAIVAADLEELARRVRYAGTDRKWSFQFRRAG